MVPFEIFRASPVDGIAVLLCLATVFWCIRVIKRRQGGPDRFLLALLGLIAISQGLKVLHDSGVWRAPQSMPLLESFVDLTVAGLYLIGALMLEISSREQIAAQVQLRIVEANSRNASEAILACADPVIITDGNGFVKRYNEPAERLLGCSQGGAMGRRIYLECEPQLRDDHSNVIVHTRRTGHS